MDAIPGNTLGVKHIGNGRHIGRNLLPVVIVHAKVFTTGRRAVVGLRRVSHAEVVGKQDSLRGELGEVGVLGGAVEAGVLKPDVHEAVESNAWDIGGGRPGLHGGSSSLDLGGARVLLDSAGAAGVGSGRSHSQSTGEAGQGLLVEHGELQSHDRQLVRRKSYRVHMLVMGGSVDLITW